MTGTAWTPGRILGLICVVSIPVVGICMLDERPPSVARSAARVDTGPAYQPPPLPVGVPDEGLTFAVASGEQDVRGFTQLALYVPAGRPAADFLPVGGFQATFRGRLRVPIRDRFVFSFVGTGEFEMKVGEQVVLSASAGQASSGKRLRLKKGEHQFTAVYKSPVSGPALLRVYWQSRDFARESIPATALSHRTTPVMARYQQLRRGRQLVQQHRCAACHADAPGGTGPPALSGIGKRLRWDWLVSWIADPRALRPDARMPKLLHGELAVPAARHLAAYLVGTTPAVASWSATDDERQVGGEIFADYGCLACHTLPDHADPASVAGRISLQYVAAKWQPAALAEFLAKPARHYPDIGMPDYGFSAVEARSVAAFLLSLPGTDLPVAGVGDPVEGERLARRYGCAACHGMAAASTVQAPQRPVTRSGAVVCGFAEFGLRPADIEALRAYLTTPRAGAFTDLEYAERTLRGKRCVNCHDLASRTALWGQVRDEAAALVAADPTGQGHAGVLPALTLAGAKLQTPWLRRWLSEGVEPRPRPWLAMPMPRFHLEAERLARGLAFAHGYPESGGVATVHNGMLVDASNAPTGDHGSELLEAASLPGLGAKLLPQDGGFGCTGCHAIAGRAAQGVFEAPGVDLALAATRLRKEYFHRWIFDPSRVDPATKMTRFIDADGLSGISDVLGGSGWAQVEAMWRYLQTQR